MSNLCLQGEQASRRFNYFPLDHKLDATAWRKLIQIAYEACNWFTPACVNWGPLLGMFKKSLLPFFVFYTHK